MPKASLSQLTSFSRNQNNIAINKSLHLSSISPKDKALIAEMVQRYRPESKYYEDSWGYIIQSTRFSGFKLHDPVNNSLIFFGRKSASDNTLVIPSYFAPKEQFIKMISDVLKSDESNKLILKNVNLSEIGEFIKCGFREYKDDEFWFEDARYDDQTFPQLVVDLTKLKEARGKKYYKLRSVQNKLKNLLLRNYNMEDKNDALNLFRLKDGQTHGMYYSSHEMYPDAPLDKYVTVSKNESKVIGFTALSRVSSDTVALVAAIFNTTYKSSSVWGIYKTLMIAHVQGFKYANLGGTERAGVNNFMKEKFRPVDEIKKTHLIFDLEQ
jgi:hypothetical protein